MQVRRRASEDKPGTRSVRLRRETSCQACQAIPWTQTAPCWSRTRHLNPPPPQRSSSRAETSRFPSTSASTSQRNCHAWNDLTAPSTSSTSSSTMSATGANARTVNTSRSPREAAGPVVRGEACADSFYAALESAVCKLESRLRRSKDRRKVHYGDKTPVSLAEATALDPLPSTLADDTPQTDGVAVDDHEPGQDRAHQGAPGQADDRRRRALRDGARRPRLLPVPRQAKRQAVRGVPQTRLRLRIDSARLAAFQRLRPAISTGHLRWTSSNTSRHPSNPKRK